MVLTRSEAKTAYTHILHNVLGRADGTPLQLALEEEGIEDVFGLVNLEAPTINNLAYSDSKNNNAITNVRTGDKMLLKCFLSYIQVRHTEGNPIRDDWDHITQADFDSFRIDAKYIIPLTNTQVTNVYGIKTDKVHNAKIRKTVHRPLLCPAAPDDLNVRAESLGGENKDIDNDLPDPKHLITLTPSLGGESNNVILSRDDIDNHLPDPKHLITLSPPPIVDPDDLIGRTFIMDAQPDGNKFCACIVKMIEDNNYYLENNKEQIKFHISTNKDTSEVITYNQLLDYLAKDDNNDNIWKFKSIASHQGPLTPKHPNCKGSTYNIMVEWEHGETTMEPLQIIARNNPVTFAVYAKDNGLLDTPGWNQFKSKSKQQKKFTRMVDQAKRRSYNTASKFKRGCQSMIGALQWMVTIGQPNITTAAMTMSGCRLVPRNGHLEMVKPTNGYLSKMPCLAIHVCIDEPDCYNLPEMENEWSKLVYGEISELIPQVATDPLGKMVTLTHYENANLMHDSISGRSVTDILYIINRITLDWYSNIIKKKETKKKLHQTNGEC
jgi:hypothetical protein